MKICISCQNSVEGKKATKVKEDRVIRTIRAVKKALGIAQMNELYVCETDMKTHTDRRKSFEKTMLFASVIAGAVLILLILSFVLSGNFDPWVIVSSFMIGAFILLLPIFKYVPAVESVQPTAVGMIKDKAKSARPKKKQETEV